ncbi:MAG: class I SAM-dependent methyltransferase [Kofleriaceae bacterium]
MIARGMILALIVALGCSRERPAPATSTVTSVTVEPAPPKPAHVAGDPALVKDQAEYVDDIVAFTKTTKEQVRERMQKGSVPLKDEWNSWEQQGPMTPERISAFYKQTTNYIYELGEWHLFVADKRASDLALVEELRKKAPPAGRMNVLDFGGGVGLLSVLLARAGLDVTLADLDSTSLTFAASRAKRHSIPLKIWKSDVEAMPPDRKYDVIVALDVFEHIPKQELHKIVDKLIRLKHDKTEILLNAPFGKTSVHPMHLDADAEVFAEIKRLQTELPKE